MAKVISGMMIITIAMIMIFVVGVKIGKSRDRKLRREATAMCIMLITIITMIAYIMKCT